MPPARQFGAPPARQFGAPPAYAQRLGISGAGSGSGCIFSHGQPLHSGGWRPFLITIILLPLLIAPLVMTCLTWLKTSDERLFILAEEVAALDRRAIVVRVLEVVAAVVSIPIVSSLLAHAAVACTQRSKAEQSLSLQQLAALSNRKWLDLTLPFTYFSPFSVVAVVLTILTVINIPLRAILIPYEPRQALVCDRHSFGVIEDTWRPKCGGHTVLGTEPLPVEYNRYSRDYVGVPSSDDNIVQAIIDGLETISSLSSTEQQQGTSWDEEEVHFWPGTPVWASSVPPLSNTGMVRQHALRYNSSASCESISAQDFPTNCDSDDPMTFTARFATDDLSLRICVPSDGWQRFENTRDAQKITEYMYLSAQAGSRSEEDALPGYDEVDYGNATVRCTAATTRGYFELPSDHNDGKPSDILFWWPSEEVMAAHFADYGEFSRALTRDIIVRWGEDAQAGPLVRVAQALFGPGSYFARVLELHEMSRETVPPDALNRQTIPLSRFLFTEDGTREQGMSFRETNWYSWDSMPRQMFVDSAHRLVKGFAKPGIGSEALSAAVHVSNQAFFTRSEFDRRDYRDIVHYAGETIAAPRDSVVGVAVSVVLLAIQVVLIFALWVYVNFKPTWTDTLDALAMMKLGAHLQGRLEFPDLGKTDSKHNKEFLRKADGLIGMESDAGPAPSADVELADMAPRPEGTAPSPAAEARSAAPEERTPGQDDEQPNGDLAEQPRVPHVSVEDTDADAASTGNHPHHRRLSLSSVGPPSSPPPSYYGSEETSDEPVMKGPYTLAVGGTGILDRSLWIRHRQYRGGRVR